MTHNDNIIIEEMEKWRRERNFINKIYPNRMSIEHRSKDINNNLQFLIWLKDNKHIL